MGQNLEQHRHSNTTRSATYGECFQQIHMLYTLLTSMFTTPLQVYLGYQVPLEEHLRGQLAKDFYRPDAIHEHC